MERECKKCKEVKEITSFTKSKVCRFGYTHTCLECNRKRWSPYYKENREERKVVENKKNRDRKTLLVNHFDNKCFDCNNSFPDCVYDFHHIDPTTKDFKLSSYRSISDKLWEEVNKCVMLCSNCHRIRHWYAGEESTDATTN